MMYFRKEIKQEEEDRHEEYIDYESLEGEFNVPFIDPSIPYEDVKLKLEPKVEIEIIEESLLTNQQKLDPEPEIESIDEPTFDGRWSSSDDETDSDDEPLNRIVKRENEEVKASKKAIPFVENKRADYWW